MPTPKPPPKLPSTTARVKETKVTSTLLASKLITQAAKTATVKEGVSAAANSDREAVQNEKGPIV